MEALVIKTTLPALEANFDVVKQQLIDGLKTYDVIITAETVKDGKTMASEINKIKKAIKDQQKKALEDIMGPVDGFKEKIQELMDLADEAREKITAQVSDYEEKTKREIQDKILLFTSEEIKKAELRVPFNIIQTVDLIKLTAQTKTGNLTTATITAIKGRVSEQKNLQLEDDAVIAKAAKEKEDEITKIREEERIKAEQNIQVHVTVDQPQATIQHESMQQFTPEEIQEPEHIAYAEPGHDYNPETGELYDTPEHMDNPREEIELEVKSGKVIITAEFEVDISSIPSITDEQLINAIQSRLKAADVNNSTIIAIQRF